jgi:hypothetical protein
VRHLGNQAGAASAASVAAGHIGLGPGLIDEDQAPRIKPALILLPSSAAAGDVGPVLLAGMQAFFETHPYASKEPPHRAVARRGATRRQLGHHTAQGEVRLLGNPRQQPPPLAFQQQRPPAAHLVGRRAAGRPVTLRPLHHAVDTHPKQRRRRPARATARDRSDNAIPKILGIGPRHRCRPPTPASILNQKPGPLGTAGVSKMLVHRL